MSVMYDWLLAWGCYSPFWWLDQQRKFWKWMAEMSGPFPTPQWATPNSVTLTLPNALLRNFSHERSSDDFRVFIAPPQAGHHSSIADYGPGQSVVEAALNRGASVYAAEWLGATPDRRNETIDDFIESTHACVEAICPGDQKLTMVGLCQGGWQSAVYAALYPEKIEHLVLAGAPIDFLAGNGKIQSYAETFPMAFYEWLVAMGAGNLPGQFMLMGFKMLNAYDRYVKDPMEVYERIDDDVYLERYRQFRNWYEYTQDIPGAFYLQVVKELFKENRLIKGELEVLGRRVDLSRIACPVTLIAGDKDDITVAPQLFNAERYLGSTDVVKMLAPAGHIGVFMGKEVVRTYWPAIFERSARIARVASRVPAAA